MRIYNSMTRKKEEFQPVHEGEVKIYACGPTVYNFIHIGNARPLIVFDTLRRYFEYRGNKVTFVQNFTDIDDKMIRAANEQGITVKELGEHFIAEYFKDAQALNVRPATVHPKATEHISDIIHLISELIEKGHAYLAENGASRSTMSKEIPWILRFGKRRNRVSLPGKAPLAWEGQAGISNAVP